MSADQQRNRNLILGRQSLGNLWPTVDPYLFCAHHYDSFPASNGQLGVAAAELHGRQMGSDFSDKDGFNMYHGNQVPGFPSHPHRGFETVTLVRDGLVDHADSLGASARFGGGDVQWLTAGKGIMHSEMLPLLNKDKPNPVEAFQIWLNLPASQKMVQPHFTMFWNEQIPRLIHADDLGKRTTVTVIAGSLEGAGQALPPPPESWASSSESDLAIWTISLEPGAQWAMPAAADAKSRRMFYWFLGDGLKLSGETLSDTAAYEIVADQVVEIINTGSQTAECLLLQGVPLNESIAKYGPFVMNTQEEIMQAMQDFNRDQFGGWPWKEKDPVFGPEYRRFARRPNATEDDVPPDGIKSQ